MKFWKMSGSGNDFVFVDARGDTKRAERWSDPGFVRAVCAPHTGIGADGVSILQDSATQDFTLLYLNRDGSVGELCGNASLCATRLAVDLGAGARDGLSFDSGAGVVRGRIRDGLPEIDLQAPAGLRPDAGIPLQADEHRIGFVNSGVPHLVIRTEELEGVPLLSRGPQLRFHESLPYGANVNWVARTGPTSWAMRTYERGVEAETLACGTGAVACAVVLGSWGEAGDQVALETRSGRTLQVSLRSAGDGRLVPSLAGEGRVVYEGILREL
jgi:diaminopimelate epimerase